MKSEGDQTENCVLTDLGMCTLLRLKEFGSVDMRSDELRHQQSVSVQAKKTLV